MTWQPVANEVLKALSHPVRYRILEQLSYRGEMTATQVAVLVDESPSNASWHLRRLAEAGLVERSETGHGRERPWRAVSDSLLFTPEAMASPVPAATAHRQVDRMLEAMTLGRTPAHGGSNATWLTDAEAQELVGRLAEIEEMMDGAAQRRQDPSTRPEGARLFEYVGWLVPLADKA